MKCLECANPAEPFDSLCVFHRAKASQRPFETHDTGGCAPPVIAEPSRARAFCQGEVVPIPEWARFLATDLDGAVWAYAERPRLESDCWAPPTIGSALELLGFTEPAPWWRDSLRDLRQANVIVLEDCGGHRGLLRAAWLGIAAYVVLEGGRALGWWHW